MSIQFLLSRKIKSDNLMNVLSSLSGRIWTWSAAVEMSNACCAGWLPPPHAVGYYGRRRQLKLAGYGSPRELNS